jgi:hypothetical protein
MRSRNAILANDHHAHNATAISGAGRLKAENAFLVKRISYLACVNTDSLIPSRASRMTSDEECSSGSTIAAEVFMNNVG